MISAVLILILAMIYFVAFPPKISFLPQYVPNGVSGEPDVRINFNLVDSEKFKRLETFSDVIADFSYVAKDKAGKDVAGSISAASEDDAKILLEARGYVVSSLREDVVGRSEPFVPYYAPQATVKKP